MIELKQPDKNLLEQVKKGAKEIKEFPSPFDILIVKRFFQAWSNDFKTYFEEIEKERKGIDLPEGFVPQTVFWLFDDDVFVGFFALRHEMTEKMMKTAAGHIAYEIIPSMRRKGYGKAGLRLVLDYARDVLGLKEVVVCCFNDNQASYKTMSGVMKEYGGYEMEKIQVGNVLKKRCLIELKARKSKEEEV